MSDVSHQRPPGTLKLVESSLCITLKFNMAGGLYIAPKGYRHLAYRGKSSCSKVLHNGPGYIEISRKLSLYYIKWPQKALLAFYLTWACWSVM
jgi:hypothetical protein